MNEPQRIYSRVTCDQRAQVLQYKSEGWKNKKISQVMQINLKTIASIKQCERKSDFRDIKRILLQQLRQSNNQIIIPENQITRRLRNLINNPEGDLIRVINEYNTLNKKKKFDSRNRKIIQQVKNTYLQTYLDPDKINQSQNDFQQDNHRSSEEILQIQDVHIEKSPLGVDQYLQQEDLPLYDIFGDLINVKNDNSFIE